MGKLTERQLAILEMIAYDATLSAKAMSEKMSEKMSDEGQVAKKT